MRKTGLAACAVLLAAGIAVAFSCWSWAYLKVDSSGCLECHALGVFGAGDGSIHGSHSNCADCHEGTPQADQVFSSACLVCHPEPSSETCDLVNFHGGSCNTCHSDCGSSTTTTTVPRINIKGNRYEIFLVGPFTEGCRATTVEFRSDNVMILDCLDGFGNYVSIGNVFIGVYWTNDYYMGYGMCMVLTGFTVYPYIAAGGFASYGNTISTVVWSGYIL